jgi:acyl-coenzyme A synthetase/AMP-(fatty) acid ligase
MEGQMTVTTSRTPSAGIAPAGNAVRRFVLDPAEAQPDRVAIIEATSERQTTRSALADGVTRAGAVLAELGVRPEQRVMMVMADRVAFLEVFWGAISIGAVPVPVSTMLAAKDYEFLLRDSRAVAVVASDVFAPHVLPATDGQPHLRHVLVEGAPDAEPRALHYDQLRDAGGGSELFPADVEDVAFWLYTSGTTGFPKAAIHRHADMAFLTDRFAR